MNVISDKKNDLLNRREVKLLTQNTSNPGFDNSVKVISEEFKAKPENIVIKNVKSKFGRDTFLIDAFIYNSVKDKDNIEPKPKVKSAAVGAK